MTDLRRQARDSLNGQAWRRAGSWRAAAAGTMRWSCLAASLWVICYLVAAFAGTATCRQAMPPCRAPSGILSFSDDFNSLDLNRWMTTYASGARSLGDAASSSPELQEYVDPSYKQLGLNPFVLQPRGRLSIRAAPVDAALARQLDGKRYISGLLTTFHSFRQKYGYFEMRARLPSGRGLWPAFWLLPEDGWPPEIDVMEALGDEPTTLYATVHTHGTDKLDLPVGFAVTVADMTAGFHRYGMLWTRQFIAWYFDGRRIAFIPTPAELSQPMYILVNLAVGGWAGKPDASTHFPASLTIDYIRAYRLPPSLADAPAATTP